MAVVFYRQCRLEKNVDNVTVQAQVVWLPDRYAQVDQYVQLRQADETWENGWLVRSVGSRLVEESQLPDAHAAIRQHRRQTGDAQPRIG